tara:strand:- start:4100 stop:6565 length:2466 start_codon:yes stop_codon:yes gene_type:complete
MARTIQSPGVEINEIDLSLRPNIPAGTSILVPGFADKGPTDEVIQVTSLSEFEQIYGLPTTPAERYFYHSVRPLFNSPANILAYRLPYGEETGAGFGNTYGALAYPAVGIGLSGAGVTLDTYTQPTSTNSNGDIVNVPGVYVLGKPYHMELTQEQYFQVLRQDEFNWTNDLAANPDSFANIGNAAAIVLNKGQTTVNSRFEGYYIGLADNTNLNDATDFDAVITAESVSTSASVTSNYLRLPPQRLNFTLSGANDATTNTFGQESDSISEIMENLTDFDITTSKYDDVLSVGLFKLRQSVFAADVIKLDYILSENYVGSFDFHRQQQSQQGGAPLSFFLGFREDESPNISVMINDNLSHRNGDTWLDLNGDPINKVRISSSRFTADEANPISTSPAFAQFQVLSSGYIPDSSILPTGVTSTLSANSAVNNALINNVFSTLSGAVDTMGPADSLFTVGAYANANLQADQKVLGSVPRKIDRLLDTIENPEVFDLDITIEAGLGTINAARKENGSDQYFDDLTNVSAMSGFYRSDITKISTEAQDYRNNWKTIYNRFNDFAEKRRKDHMFIADLPRPIFVQGRNFRTLDDPEKNFSLNISKPVQAFTTILNSSYSTTYAAWNKVYDSSLDDQVWVPFSGTAASQMANTDANFQPWFAPAGFTRGRVGSVNDIVLYPKQKQRDQLYKNSVNPVAFFPGDGFVTFGQKTLQAAPTAFDRINVRRLFLNLEKATRNTVKYFLFEPNTLLTRTRVINTLTPIFENAKNTEGLYDYLIVCDERNNTPDVIDQNEMVVDIYLKPVRAAEFILVNFYATRTGTDFNEIVG